MRIETDRETYRELAAGASPGVRIPVEGRVTVSDPYAAYRRARGDSWGVYLETTGGQSGWGYFGVEPTGRVTVAPGAVACDATGAERTDGHGDYAERSATLATLDGLLADERLRRGSCNVPIPGGVVGWLSYDVARELESLPDATRDDRELPRLQAARFETLAAWEAPHGDSVTLRLCASPRIGVDSDEIDERDAVSEAVIDATYDRAVASIESLADRIQTGDPSVGPAPVAADGVRFTSERGPTGYADAVRAVREYVRDGDTFQANVSHRLTAPAAVHPVETYAALRRVNPAPYSGLFEFRDADLVSASPELLLRRTPDDSLPAAAGSDDRHGDAELSDRRGADQPNDQREPSVSSDQRGTGELETEPIAGTRPRGETAADDETLADDLRSDEKERAEHAMLVDLERNDLGKVSVPGSVDVSEYRRVDRYASVMHLVSRVVGRERADRTLADSIAAVFPGGTITGAPKPRTMEIIEELETTRRGPYTGSAFAVGFDGRAVLNILIRTLVRTDGEYHLRVGAGIVHDSVPEREYEETLDKARGLVSALDDRLDGAQLGVGDDDAVTEGVVADNVGETAGDPSTTTDDRSVTGDRSTTTGDRSVTGDPTAATSDPGQDGGDDR